MHGPVSAPKYLKQSTSSVTRFNPKTIYRKIYGKIPVTIYRKIYVEIPVK
jgi:hypothetical protein